MSLTALQRFRANPYVDIAERLPMLPANLLKRRALSRRIRPGDYFINGRDNHPCLVVRCELTAASAVGPWNYDIVGVSIVDGHTDTSNSAEHSGLTPLCAEVAIDHLIVSFWERGTGPKVWQAAAKHVGDILGTNADYRAFVATVC